MSDAVVVSYEPPAIEDRAQLEGSLMPVSSAPPV
jgi:hypothetical protein